MKFLFLLFLLLMNGCSDNSELTLKKIEYLDKKNKLASYISKIQTLDELNQLMNFLSDDLKKDYLSSTASKEQDLRFPRPTPMTIEYLDSITNGYVYRLASEYTNEVDTTLKDVAISDRLVLIETFHIRYFYTNNKFLLETLKQGKFLSEINMQEKCQNFYKNIFYNAVYHDPVDNKYYFGETFYTNNVEYILPDTNGITLGTPESIIHITNLSPSKRLYFDLNSNILFVRKISRIIEQHFGTIYFKGKPYSPEYYIIDDVGNRTDYMIRLLMEGNVPVLLFPERSSWLEGSWILWCLSQNADDKAFDR